MNKNKITEWIQNYYKETNWTKIMLIFSININFQLKGIVNLFS